MTKADVPEVVVVHAESFEGFFLTSLGPRFLTAFYTGLLRDETGFAFVVESDGRVVGFVAGSTVPAGFYRRLLRKRWWVFAVAALPLMLRHPKTAKRVLRAVSHPRSEPSAPGVAKIFSIAVHPSFEKRGIGRTLIDKSVEESFSRGSMVLSLETDADGNEKTNAFYRSVGFQGSREYTTPEGRRMIEYVLDLEKKSGEH